MIRVLKALAIALALCLVSGLGYAGYLRATDNFHAVAPGVVYRAWQPAGADLQSFARDFGRGSVINLRGAHPGKEWYDEERRAAADAGLSHFDFKMSATKLLTPERARELVALIERAPKPVLIHCKAGADRAGLAAAVYLYGAKGASADEALRQLSLLYGHFPYLGSRTAAMTRSFDAFVAAGHTPDTQRRDLAVR